MLHSSQERLKKTCVGDLLGSPNFPLELYRGKKSKDDFKYFL